MDDGRSDARASELRPERREIRAPRIWTGDGREIWVVVEGSPEDDLFGLLTEDTGAGTELRLCRAILEDGVLVLGHAEPGSDPLFRDPSHGDDGGGH
jgi:hypothetical protein